MFRAPLVWRLGAGLTAGLVIFLPAWIIWRGLPALSFPFVGELEPELFASAYVLATSLLMAFPLALAVAIYLNEYATPRAAMVFTMLLEMQASVPAVVIGMFGMIVFVEKLHLGFTLLGGAASLAVLNLPFLIRTAQEAMGAAPRDQREGSLALGVSKLATWWQITMPQALPFLGAGLVLASGRALGEAAAVLFTAGAVSAPTPLSLNPLGPGATLSVHLWYLQAEGAANSQGAEAIATLLVILWLGLVLIAKLLGGRRR